MNVVFRMSGDVEVEDQIHTWNIQTTTRDIGRYTNRGTNKQCDDDDNDDEQEEEQMNEYEWYKERLACRTVER